MDPTKNIHNIKADIIGIKEGEHTSFEKIFHLFFHRVFNFILSLTKNDDIAEELSQQVFVNLWENRNKIDPEKNFNTYLFMMAKHTALGYFRTLSLHREIEQQVIDENPVDNMEDEIFTREAYSLINTTISRMPNKRRKIYELSQLRNKTNEEIAKELNITKKAVEKHLRLALNDIRVVLKKYI